MDISIINLEEENDLAIYKLVHSKQTVNSDILERAKKIYEERDLDSPLKQKLIAEFPYILSQAESFALKPSSNEGNLITFFRARGVDEKQIPLLINKYFKTEAEKAKSKEASKSNTWVIIGAVVLVIQIIRLIIR